MQSRIAAAMPLQKQRLGSPPLGDDPRIRDIPVAGYAVKRQRTPIPNLSDR